MSIILESELSSTLIDFFTRRTGTVIIATLDGNYRPHTAPFHYLAIVDPKHLLLAISFKNQTYQNILQNKFVSLAILDEGDLAVCIRGYGEILLEQMVSDRELSVIAIEITEIRKNNWESHHVTQGIRITHKNEIFLINSRRIFQELLQIATQYSG